MPISCNNKHYYILYQIQNSCAEEIPVVWLGRNWFLFFLSLERALAPGAGVPLSFLFVVWDVSAHCMAYAIKPWSTQAGKYSARMVLWEQDFLSQIDILEPFTAIFCNRSSLFFNSIVSDFHWPVSCVIIQVAVFWCCHQEEIEVKTQTSKENHSLWLQ